MLLVTTTAFAVHEVMPEGEATAREALAHAQEVQSISIDGRHLPMLALRETLATHVGDKLDGARLESDRHGLEAALVASGYLAARVDAPIVTFGDGGAAFVTFPVVQGDMFHLRSVSVSGTSPRDAGVLTIGKGDEAIADRIERARQGVAERLSTRGKHTVTVRQAVDTATATVDVELIAH
jgi:outer membrane protein assembly factor BamA